MGVKVRRCVMVAGIGVLLVPAAVSAATTSKQVDAAAAARSCAHGRGLHARLGAHDVAYLAHFLPCIVRTDRRQLGLHYTRSVAASRLAAHALAHLMTLPYVRTHQLKAASQAEIRAGGDVAIKMCERRGFHRAFFQVSLGDTAPPPVLTPIVVSRLIAFLFASPRAVARLPRTAWAVAFGHGLVFQKDNPNGASALIVDFACP
jgi:hypothetical protein